MSDFTGEISQQFAPSLPEKKASTLTQAAQSSKTGLLGGLFRSKPESIEKIEEIPSGTVDERAKVLLQLLIEQRYYQ